MKKMISRRSFLAAAGVSAAALALTACGGSSSSTAASSTATSAAASTAGSAAAASGDTIKVGVMGPMTGDVSVYGLAVINGANLYLDQVNAKGGINGRGSEKGLIIMKLADIICSRIVQRTAILGLIAAGRDMKTDICVVIELLYDRQRVCNHGQPVIR